MFNFNLFIMCTCATRMLKSCNLHAFRCEYTQTCVILMPIIIQRFLNFQFQMIFRAFLHEVIIDPD